MKATLLVGILAAMLVIPGSAAIIGLNLSAPAETIRQNDDLVNEDIDFEPEIADLLGCDGLHVVLDDEGNADAYFYNWVEDENGDLVKEECDPAGGLLLNNLVADELINEDTDFDPEVAGIVGCEGLHVFLDDEGNADAYLYNWVEDENGELVKEECDPSGALSTVATQHNDELINEDADFDPEVAGTAGCEGLHVFLDDEGNADAYFYNWVEDENGDLVKEECDPLA